MGSSGWPCIFTIGFRHPDEWISESQQRDRPRTVVLSIEGWWDGWIGSSLRRPSLRTDAPIPIHGSGAHKDPPWGTLLGCLDMVSGARPILAKPCGHPDEGTRPSRRRDPPIPTKGPAHPDEGTRPSRRRGPPIPTKGSADPDEAIVPGPRSCAWHPHAVPRYLFSSPSATSSSDAGIPTKGSSTHQDHVHPTLWGGPRRPTIDSVHPCKGSRGTSLPKACRLTTGSGHVRFHGQFGPPVGRVAPGRLPSRGPHGSGRADFPHPALRSSGSLRGVPVHDARRRKRKALQQRDHRGPVLCSSLASARQPLPPDVPHLVA